MYDVIRNNKHTNVLPPSGKDLRETEYKTHKQFGDHGGGVTGAHTYLHADEAKCDQHMETFIKCIKASGNKQRVNY